MASTRVVERALHMGRHADRCPPFRCGLVSWSLPWEDQQAHHSLGGEAREPQQPLPDGFVWCCT